MSAERFHKKLLAWLAEPWDLVFWPPDGRAEARSEWQQAVQKLFALPQDPELLAEIEQRIRGLESLPHNSTVVDFRAQPLFIHPLSGERIEVQEWTDLSGRHNEIRQTALSVLNRVAHAVQDPAERFLALWRLAPDLLKELENKNGCAVKLGPSWDIVPAFDFAPYVTVWQRNAIASALASALPSPAFLSFRLGGAQEFIGHARTTEDYWAGSYLISYLTWKAAEVVVAEFGPDAAMFPSLCGQPLVDLWLRMRPCFTSGSLLVPKPDKQALAVSSFPNGLLAIVPAGDENAARRLGRRTQAGFAKEWRSVCESVKTTLESELSRSGYSLAKPDYWNDLWRRQTPADRVFELFWTVTPWPEGASYREIFCRASRDMESRKTLRDFRGEPEPNIKCHQCGLREALQDRDGVGSDALWTALAALPGDLQYRFRPRERLCAVCATRRLALRAHFRVSRKELRLRLSFPSTSSITITPYLRKMLEAASKVNEAAEQFAQELRKADVPTILESPFERLEQDCGQLQPQTAWWLFLHIDGDWWFEETYEPKRLREDYGDRFKGKETGLKNALDQLRKLRGALKDQMIEGPPNYFAVLTADGDQAGDWIRGDLLPSWSESLHPAAVAVAPSVRRAASPLTHLALSQCLGNLLATVRPVIEGKLDGTLVYAGGDELLALVPVARLADGMQAYSEKFSRSHEKLATSYRLLPGKRFTASAAAFVLHHTEPLQGAIAEAHRWLKGVAKEQYGRASGVIVVRRQSGQQTYMGAKWRPSGVKEPPFALVQKLTDGMADKHLSPRFITHVAALSGGLESVISEQNLSKMFGELLRKAQGEANIAGKAILTKLPELLKAYCRLAIERATVEELRVAWRQLEQALLIARFLARKV